VEARAVIEILPLPHALHIVFDTVNRVYRLLLLLPPQASTLARRIDGLHYLEITIFTLIAIAYYGVAVWFLVRYRARPGRDHGPLIQAPVLIGMWGGGLFAVFTLLWLIGQWEFRQIRTAPANAVDVYVTAKQWMWEFAYTDGGSSVGVLYVPVNQPVRLLLTSRDVIHSFFVPAFRLKQDAVPGTYTTLWFDATQTGTYPIECTQMCGPGHSTMLAQVAVLSREDYDRWRADEASPAIDSDGASPVEAGRRAAADFGCLKCHTIDGQPHIGPTWLGLYGSQEQLQNGERVIVDPAYITESMMDPTAKIVAGFPPIMPSFQGIVTPADTAALIEYMKSLGDPKSRGGRP
jgi:cytochrome c oxidase subunit 2